MHPGIPLLATIIAVATGCAHDSFGIKNDTRSVARRLGFPQCNVSVPLNQDELLTHAKRLGNPNLQSSIEWTTVLAMAKPGDEFRHVDCLGKARGTDAGLFFYALFRDQEAVARFGYTMFD